MMNIFVTPGDVFEEVTARPPSLANWLAPALLSCLVGMISVWIIFSQDTILHQLREQRERAMAGQLAKLSQADRDKFLEDAEKLLSPILLKAFGSIGVVMSTFLWLFFLALVLWALGRWAFEAKFAYFRTLEVVSLSGMILVLGGIIGTLLIVTFSSMTATPGPVLLIRNFDATNKLHQLAASCNLVTFWYIAVLSIGLGKLSGVSMWKAFAWLFGIWAVLRAILVVSGVGT